MNSASIKAKGRDAENRVVEYLKSELPDSLAKYVERRRLTGARDKGDIAGIPGVVIEVKAEQGFKLAEWVKELEAELVNAGGNIGAVVHKRRGTLNVADWYVTMPAWMFTRMLRLAFNVVREGK